MVLSEKARLRTLMKSKCADSIAPAFLRTWRLEPSFSAVQYLVIYFASSFSLAKTGSVSSVWYSRSAIRKTMVGLFPFAGDKKKEQKRIAKKVFISLIHARNRIEVESEKSGVFTFAS